MVQLKYKLVLNPAISWCSIIFTTFAYLISFILWPGLLWSNKIISSVSDAFAIIVGSWKPNYSNVNFISLLTGNKRQVIICLILPVSFSKFVSTNNELNVLYLVFDVKIHILFFLSKPEFEDSLPKFLYIFYYTLICFYKNIY